jgi:glycosyltransferase involved in cell wall biosynthesis
VRIVYFKPELAWPRVSGHDVHCYYMVKALASLGHRVSLATVTEPKPEAIAGLTLSSRWALKHVALPTDAPQVRLSRLQQRFVSYWGVPVEHIRSLAALACEDKADAVIVDGLNVLPYLGAVDGACRVWFAADEWIWHHLSQFRLTDGHACENLRAAAVKGLYEWAYASVLDRVWVVSEADRRAMSWVTKHPAIDVLPNGVDSEYYGSSGNSETQNSCVFWGRLDFGPNIQALQWFCGKVWPQLRREVPQARLTIFGFKPTNPVRALAGRDGITLTPDLPDIRNGIAQHQVVVLPFVSGGGVKSKLLEAFSMGKAVVGTQRACNGLFGGPSPPLMQAKGVRQWVQAIRALWDDGERRKHLGASARQWVLNHHTWHAAARVVLAGLEKTLQAKGPK